MGEIVQFPGSSTSAGSGRASPAARPSRRWWTSAEVAGELSVSVSTVYRWAERGHAAAKWFGRTDGKTGTLRWDSAVLFAAENPTASPIRRAPQPRAHRDPRLQADSLDF
jgi:hypothetical protein